MAAGYSGTPLAKKLGIKENQVTRLINPPDHYFELIDRNPQDLAIDESISTEKDFVHLFTTESAELLEKIPALRKEIKQNGMIWVSWPKKASKISTDVTEDVIRTIALENGLVDVKVCAVDAIWSGLKLVIPISERKK